MLIPSNPETPLRIAITQAFGQKRDLLNELAERLQEKAVDVQKRFREARTDYQKGHKRYRNWVHDIRLKNTPNGVSIEWIFYEGRFGDSSRSQGIQGETGIEKGFKVPMRNFASCSAIEKMEIKNAENDFAQLRQMTYHFSSIARSMNAVLQMKSSTQKDSTDEFNGPPRYCEDCGCMDPCDDYLNWSKYRCLE